MKEMKSRIKAIDDLVSLCDDVIAKPNIPTLTATSNTTACTITGLPAGLYPTTQQRMVSEVTDNGTIGSGLWQIQVDGTITLYASVAGASFTNSGTKGVSQGMVVTYMLGV